MVNSYSNDSNQRSALEKELAQVETAIQELIQKRLQLKRKINDCCPILTLPPEISIRFFMTTFPENSFFSWGKATPLLLGAVCHTWRELAWSFPQLWSSVSFIVRRYSNTKNSLLQEWLARSGDLPLSIHLRMGEPPNHSGIREVMWKDTMAIITCCSERWQAVDFRLFFMFHPKTCPVPTQFPLLTSMSISLVPLFHDSFDTARLTAEIARSSPQVVWNTPKLQYIHVDPGMERHKHPNFHLSLKQKTSFSWIGAPSSQRCLEILKDAPNLVKCQFGGVRGGTFSQFPSITALQLGTLEIGFTCTSNVDTCVSDFLNNLTTPALRKLSISQSEYNVPFPSEAFISLMSRSACHLVRLSLSKIILSANELASCLSTTPLLSELQLEQMKITSETFKVLSVDEAFQNTLLPNLESFTYVQGRFSHYTLDLTGLLRMARSRRHFDPLILNSWQRVVKLKSICIEFHYDGHGNLDSNDYEDVLEGSDSALEGESTKLNRRLIARFRRLIDEGMDIRILEGYKKTDLLKPDADMYRPDDVPIRLCARVHR